MRGSSSSLKAYRLAPLKFPDSDEREKMGQLWEPLRFKLAQIDLLERMALSEKALVSALSPVRQDAILKRSSTPLSQHFSAPRRSLEAFERRDPAENIVARLLEAQGRDLSIKDLEAAAAIAVGAPVCQIRSQRLGTMPTENGARIEFVAPEQLVVALNSICACWAAAGDDSECFTAVWLMVALMTAHPFTDGNGRVGRALLNAYLIKQGIIRSHFPLGPLLYSANMNYLIAVRHVNFKNEWRHLLHVIDVCIDEYLDILKFSTVRG